MNTHQEHPWQLQMFDRSLKKRIKLRTLLSILGEVDQKKCLLVTCGDNNGALNWHFRAHGGDWTWGDVAGENLEEMMALLDETVYELPEDHFPFENDLFDCVVSIDVLEHLEDDQPFLREIHRVLRQGGRAIVTVPNGDPTLLANRVKWWIGMRPEVYGHTRAGYTNKELHERVQRVGLIATNQGGYSRFFTEIVELLINYGYVFILSRQRDGIELGKIAPSSSSELKTHGFSYRLYSLVFPLLRAFTRLDRVLPRGSMYAVIVEAVKP